MLAHHSLCGPVFNSSGRVKFCDGAESGRDAGVVGIFRKQWEQFKSKIMNEVLGNVKGLMPDVLGNSLPSTTGESISPLPKLKLPL